jgi:hypothetical protein
MSEEKIMADTAYLHAQDEEANGGSVKENVNAHTRQSQ